MDTSPRMPSRHRVRLLDDLVDHDTANRVLDLVPWFSLSVATEDVRSVFDEDADGLTRWAQWVYHRQATQKDLDNRMVIADLISCSLDEIDYRNNPAPFTASLRVCEAAAKRIARTADA